VNLNGKKKKDGELPLEIPLDAVKQVRPFSMLVIHS
jgi:hypothetical protein